MSADPRYGRLDARERRNLRELEKRLSGSAVTPRAVGGALPEAVLTDNTDRQKLAKSIMGVTEDAITRRSGPIPRPCPPLSSPSSDRPSGKPSTSFSPKPWSG